VIGELVFQLVGEILCYGTGRVIVRVFTPTIQVPPTSSDPWPRESKHRWFAMTYGRDGRRYYYESTVTFIGVLFWIVVAVAVIVAIRA
jgi:hypothetical protein